MKKYITKVTGTQIYNGSGYDYIFFRPSNNERDKTQFDVIPFEIILTDEEYTPDTIYQLPNGMLVIRTCYGDEQTSSSLHILKDWKTELIEEDIEIKDYEKLRTEFTNSIFSKIPIPKKIKELLNID